MFWSKKGPPPPEPAGQAANARPRSDGRSDAELDLAVETLAEILRARANHAYAMDDEDVTTVSNTFERWASHVLVRAAAPGDTEIPREGGPGPREWRKLATFATLQSKKEKVYVERSVHAAREAIFVLVESFTCTSTTQNKHDVILRDKLVMLKSALQSGSLERLKHEAIGVAAAVTDALEEQKGVAQRHAAELREKLTSLGEQLERTKKDADTDALTKLVNRRAFDMSGDRAVAMASLMGRPLTLLMVDIDRFKAINDNFGHPAGDQVLRSVSDELVRTFPRRSDVVARYGGEEFAILFVDTPKSEGKRLAERLLSAVRGLAIPVGENAVGVTVSVGLAELMADESALALVERADRALYAAKQTGRNRLVEADEHVSAFEKTTNNNLVAIQKAG